MAGFRWVRLVLVAVVVAGATTLGVALASSSPSTYPVSAVFSRAPGLYPGAAVEVLGVRVGTVVAVHNVGDQVRVTMEVDRGRPVPASASASLVAPELLGTPDIELEPGYTGGPTLRPGSTIPEARTSVPVSTNELLKSLQKTLSSLNPHAVGDLVTNLAQDLDGQAQGLKQLIAGAAGTIQLLANKEDGLGQLSGTLAQLTGSLDSRTAEISHLITEYDTVSSVIAGHSSQLTGAITELSGASTQLVQLLTPNLAPLEQDVGTVTTVGRTLDRNLGSIDQTLTSATALFAAAQRAYTPTHEWLNLNLQTPTGVTGAYVVGLVRDRLAGVCRRIAANHSAGLTASELHTLATCGNPDSGFFDPLLSQVPTILSDIQSGAVPSAPPSPAALFQKGLSQIPGLATAPAPVAPTPGAATAPTASTGAASGSGATSGTPSGSGGSAPGSGSKPCLGGLLGSILTCSPTGSSGSTSSSTSGSSSTNSSPNGLGGLLSYRAKLASSTGGVAGTSLTAASATDLPPLPATAPGASPHDPHRAHPHRAHPHRAHPHRSPSRRSSGGGRR